MIASIKRCVAVLGLAFLGFAGPVILWGMPVSAAALGITAGCAFTSTTRAQCNIPVLSATFNAEIHYFTTQCSSNGVAYNLKQVQILSIPPNGTADVAYQVGGNRASVAGVANLGAIVDVHAKANTTSAALIDFSVAPTGTTSCTISLTATY